MRSSQLSAWLVVPLLLCTACKDGGGTVETAAVQEESIPPALSAEGASTLRSVSVKTQPRQLVVKTMEGIFAIEATNDDVEGDIATHQLHYRAVGDVRSFAEAKIHALRAMTRHGEIVLEEIGEVSGLSLLNISRLTGSSLAPAKFLLWSALTDGATATLLQNRRASVARTHFSYERDVLFFMERSDDGDLIKWRSPAGDEQPAINRYLKNGRMLGQTSHYLLFQEGAIITALHLPDVTEIPLCTDCTTGMLLAQPIGVPLALLQHGSEWRIGPIGGTMTVVGVDKTVDDYGKPLLVGQTVHMYESTLPMGEVVINRIKPSATTIRMNILLYDPAQNTVLVAGAAERPKLPMVAGKTLDRMTPLSVLARQGADLLIRETSFKTENQELVPTTTLLAWKGSDGQRTIATYDAATLTAVHLASDDRLLVTLHTNPPQTEVRVSSTGALLATLTNLGVCAPIYYPDFGSRSACSLRDLQSVAQWPFLVTYREEADNARVLGVVPLADIMSLEKGATVTPDDIGSVTGKPYEVFIGDRIGARSSAIVSDTTPIPPQK
jgi:hypothetical protein